MDFPFGGYTTYKSNAGVGDAKLGQWLGVLHRIGPEMVYWILPESCQPISCTTVQRLTNLEIKQDIWRNCIDQFKSKTKRILEAQSSCIQPDPQIIQSGKLLSLELEDDDFTNEYNRVINSPHVKHIEDLRIGDDHYIGMELGIHRGDEPDVEHAVVKKRRVDDEGKPIGISNKNPLLDTAQYKVEFSNGDI